ncbi:MAG: hypothetical protein LUQ71_07520 [Methanoregula sp.]|nr:hypothetical protein [Methanoregula sp.]
MDNLNLGSDESVIHTTQELIIDGIGYEAVLTGSRLILVDHDSGTPRESIPFASIGLAAGETNRLREPVIQLTFSAPDGSPRGIKLIFIHQAAHRHFQNRDKCMDILRDKGVPTRLEPYRDYSLSATRKDSMDAGTLELGQPQGRPAVPEWTIYGIQGGKTALPEEPQPTSPLVTFIVVILIAAIIIGAMIVPIPGPGDTQAGSSAVITGSATSITQVPTPVPTPPVTPQPTETSAPETRLLPGSVPGNGIWVKIIYPGNYAGFLSAGGMRVEVNSSGTQVYQLPVHDTVIDGFIEKADGSGDMLEIEVYNGGTLVASQETTTPRGLAEIHVPVGPAIMNSASPVTTPVPAVTTETISDASAVLSGVVPPTGVFVYVIYPGQYSGSISENGRARDVDSSGNQYYQVPLSSGNIEIFIDKGDESVREMTVQVYKEGTLVTSGSTSRPHGMVEIHTVV